MNDLEADDVMIELDNKVDQEAFAHLRNKHDAIGCEECPAAVMTLITALIDRGHGNALADYIRGSMALEDNEQSDTTNESEAELYYSTVTPLLQDPPCGICGKDHHDQDCDYPID